MSGNIKVVCRFRPQNSKERAKGAHEIINLSADGTTITVQGQSNHTFNFDKIWGPSATQSQVYDYAARPVVEGSYQPEAHSFIKIFKNAPPPRSFQITTRMC